MQYEDAIDIFFNTNGQWPKCAHCKRTMSRDKNGNFTCPCGYGEPFETIKGKELSALPAITDLN